MANDDLDISMLIELTKKLAEILKNKDLESNDNLEEENKRNE